MTTPADLLWRVNNEYQKRLKQAQTCIGLLEQLILMQGGDQTTLTVLRHALEQLELLLAEHRVWRHSYYYESEDTRRMVQSQRAIQRAIAHFSQMHTHHEHALNNLHTLLEHLQRPDPALTRVPNGDLWMMTEYALDNLWSFDDYLRSLERVS